MFISLIFFLSSNPAAATTASTHRQAGCNDLRTFVTSLVPSIVRGREMGRGNARGKNRDWHGQERPRGGQFANGRTARQELNPQDYWILKKSHPKWIDTRSRNDCISWCGTMILRHLASCEGRKVVLAPDGSMDIETFLSFRMCRSLDVSVSDMDEILRRDKLLEDGKIRFHETRNKDGSLARIAVVQGHSTEAQRMIDENQHMKPAGPDDPLWVDILLLGTLRIHVDSILRQGLLAGGLSKDRAHIHIVSRIDAFGRKAGVRDNSEVVIRIDMRGY